LSSKLELLPLPSAVTVVYNPIEYAREPHGEFNEKYMNAPKKVLFLGMNPGPWGMAQTGA
jgi:single-strand selective monofunctional uracil DNA glycosylase